MLNFPNITIDEFLTEYWQKKPLLIPKALPQFKNHLSPEELAGLSMEEEIESRLVIQNLEKPPLWQLLRGPFKKKDFKKLPKSHWTLLVQGVDRFVPEIMALWDYFDFIPQWRIDDIMISVAAEQGSVGPHYDNYDVFLYQAQGRRRWLLTSKDCVESNYLQDAELRIMKEFKVEQEYILEEGDMLYLPPEIGHHGIALTDDCMTYSFGYRSYRDLELWDSFGDYLSSKKRATLYYRDPSWNQGHASSELPMPAWRQAKTLMQSLLEDDGLMQEWFGSFATALDSQAEELMPMVSSEEDPLDRKQFKQLLCNAPGLERNPLCRLAYSKSVLHDNDFTFYINGEIHCVDKASILLVEMVANKRRLLLDEIVPFLEKNPHDESFLYGLWKLEILELMENDRS